MSAVTVKWMFDAVAVAIAFFIIAMTVGLAIHDHPTGVIAECVRAGFTQKQWQLYEERD